MFSQEGHLTQIATSGRTVGEGKLTPNRQVANEEENEKQWTVLHVQLCHMFHCSQKQISDQSDFWKGSLKSIKGSRVSVKAKDTPAVQIHYKTDLTAIIRTVIESLN